MRPGMDQQTQDRLTRLEKRLDDLDALLERLMLLAGQHPLGRKLLTWMAKENAR